jgi:DNA-binding response OmpR family regulator
MTPLCPHCGYNLRQDEPIELDGFRIDPRGGVEYLGRRIALQPNSQSFLGTLAKAAPRPVTKEVLGERFGARSERSIEYHLTKLRRYLAAAGVPSPVRNIHGFGYRWEMPS